MEKKQKATTGRRAFMQTTAVAVGAIVVKPESVFGGRRELHTADRNRRLRRAREICWPVFRRTHGRQNCGFIRSIQRSFG